jgi:hypothetical protein
MTQVPIHTGGQPGHMMHYSQPVAFSPQVNNEFNPNDRRATIFSSFYFLFSASLSYFFSHLNLSMWRVKGAVNLLNVYFYRVKPNRAILTPIQTRKKNK